MARIWGSEDPWAAPPEGALRLLVRRTAQIVVPSVVFLLVSVGGLFLNELRLQAVEREYHATLRPLVAGHATVKEIQAALDGLHQPQVYRLSDPAAIGASDRRVFTFVLSTAYVKGTVLLDAQSRATGYRVERSGTAL